MAEGRQFPGACLLKNVTFICGGYGNSSIEGFHMLRELFFTSHIRLPEAHSCISWSRHDKLIVLSRSYALKYTVSPEGYLSVPKQKPLPTGVYKYHNSPPFAHQKKVYFLFEGKVISASY